VRAAGAEEMGLSVAAKRTARTSASCRRGKYSDIIAKLPASGGDGGEIVHIDGRVLGRHDGILRYTVGQRRGIGVASGEPLYVVHLDSRAPASSSARARRWRPARSILRDLNWLGEFARVRSTKKPVPAVLRHVDGKAEVELSAGEQGVAPGQACVLYDGEGDGARIFGGGFIARSERAAEAEAMLRRISA
jgi:tRNA-specific 2-thiouridylase